MICAPGSGSGKTLITCALIRILMKKGYDPASFKCGPDYIDPMFHKTVLGIPSRNLDLFLAGREGVLRSFAKGMNGRNFGVLEGVMGFFDGMSAGSTEGSSYEVSCVTDTPAILVVNTKGMSNSVIPLVKGFCEYGEQRQIKGIILNNIPPSIAGEISKKILEETGVPVIGTLPVMKDAGLQSRHLGLVLPGEIEDLLEIIDKVADELEKTLDFDKLLEIAESASNLGNVVEEKSAENVRDLCASEGTETSDCSNVETRQANPEGAASNVRIGVALDEAFCFYYQDNLELLEELGAQLQFFSPIHDEKIPDVDRLIFGGGYPELYAKELSQNRTMLQSIKNAANDGMPVLAECGGFLFLMERIVTPEGNEYEMAGVLKGKSHMRDKMSHFGYVKVTKNKDNRYIKDDEVIKGHEFHYYEATDEGDVCNMTKPSGKRSWMGYQTKGDVFGGFAHLYYPSCVSFIKRFIDA